MNLWSYVQLAVLTALALAGSSVQVHHVDLAFRYDGDLEIDLDPVFLVETDPNTARLFTGRSVDGFAFGNIAVVCSRLGRMARSYVTAHELTHVLQFRALGPFAFLFYAMNPPFFEGHLTRCEKQKIAALPKKQRMKRASELLIDSMWLPPVDWFFVWSLFKYKLPNESFKINFD